MALNDKISICSQCNSRYMYKPGSIPTRSVCSSCGAKLLHTNLTAEEHFLIQHISKDRDFLMAMIELKKNNIIEYQTKIAQYRQIAKADGCYTSPAEKAKQNIPKCPVCGSTDISPISTGERAISIIGFGIMSKKINKSFKCNNKKCKYTW